MVTATRPLKGEVVKLIITFPTPSGTEWQASTDPRSFRPNLFVETCKEDVDAKIKAMGCYEFEKREYPHPRSPRALEIISEAWGITIGTNYAEAFSIIRVLC